MKPTNIPNSESKDMCGRGEQAKRMRLRLNTELDETLSAKLKIESAAKNIDQADLVRAALRAMLFPGKTRKIFASLLDTKFERECNSLITEALWLFSTIRSTPIFFSPEQPLIEHVNAGLTSAKIDDIRELLEKLIRQVVHLNERKGPDNRTKSVSQIPDKSGAETRDLP